jgi:hypothetical protein
MEMVFMYFLTAEDMKEILKMIFQMGMVFFIILMDWYFRVFGKMELKMGKVLKYKMIKKEGENGIMVFLSSGYELFHL